MPNIKDLKLSVGCHYRRMIIALRLSTILKECIIGRIFVTLMLFLNQARAGLRSAYAWFLEITFVHDVCMCAFVCVCVCPQGY